MELEGNDVQLRNWLGQWEGYKAQSQTELAMFDGQLKGHTAGIDGQRAVLDGLLAANAGKRDVNKGLLDQYTAQWAGIKTQADAAGMVLDAALKGPALEVDIARAKMSEGSNQLQLAIENAKLNQGKGMAQAQCYVERIKAMAEMANQSSNTMATVGANIMGSYLTAGQINLSVSQQASCSTTKSLQRSYSRSYSSEQRDTESHNYNCDC
jgi:hypothetical protein